MLAANGLPLEDLGKLLLAAGNVEDAEEGADAGLVDSGIALKVLAQALKEYAAKASKEKSVKEWKASSLDIKKFVPEVPPPPPTPPPKNPSPCRFLFFLAG